MNDLYRGTPYEYPTTVESPAIRIAPVIIESPVIQIVPAAPIFPSIMPEGFTTETDIVFPDPWRS